MTCGVSDCSELVREKGLVGSSMVGTCPSEREGVGGRKAGRKKSALNRLHVRVVSPGITSLSLYLRTQGPTPEQRLIFYLKSWIS